MTDTEDDISDFSSIVKDSSSVEITLSGTRESSVSLVTSTETKPSRTAETATISSFTEHVSLTATKAESNAVSIAESKAESSTGTKAKYVTESKAGSNTEANAESLTQPKAEFIDEAKAESKTEAKAKSETEKRAASPSETKAESLDEAKAESITGAKTESKTETSLESKTETNVESKTETKVESITDTKSESSTEAKAESITVANTATKAESKNGTQSEIKGEIKADINTSSWKLASGSDTSSDFGLTCLFGEPCDTFVREETTVSSDESLYSSCSSLEYHGSLMELESRFSSIGTCFSTASTYIYDQNEGKHLSPDKSSSLKTVTLYSSDFKLKSVSQSELVMPPMSISSENLVDSYKAFLLSSIEESSPTEFKETTSDKSESLFYQQSSTNVSSNSIYENKRKNKNSLSNNEYKMRSSTDEFVDFVMKYTFYSKPRQEKDFSLSDNTVSVPEHFFSENESSYDILLKMLRKYSVSKSKYSGVEEMADISSRLTAVISDLASKKGNGRPSSHHELRSCHRKAYPVSTKPKKSSAANKKKELCTPNQKKKIIDRINSPEVRFARKVEVLEKPKKKPLKKIRSKRQVFLMSQNKSICRMFEFYDFRRLNLTGTNIIRGKFIKINMRQLNMVSEDLVIIDK